MKRIVIILLLSCFFAHFDVAAQSPTQWNQRDEQGLKTGPWRGAYPGGQVRYIGQFKADMAIDTFFYYYEDGRVKSIMIHDPLIQDQAYAVHFYSTHDTLAKGRYLNQMKEGTWISYGDRSVPVEVGSYTEGKKNGKWTIYYQDGVISEIMHFKNDIENGPYKTYFENGQIRMDAFYLNGALHGQVLYYAENGKKEQEGEYVEGLREGKWLIYDKNELVVKLLRYEGGKVQNPEALDSLNYDMQQFHQQRKDYLEFEDLRGRIKYE